MFLNKPYNEKVDVFAFGIVIFEIFSKRLLVADYMNTADWDESQTHAERVSNGWRPAFPVNMPESIRKLVDKCWAGIPELRPTREKVLHRLQEIGRSGDVTTMDDVQAKAQGCACSIM